MADRVSPEFVEWFREQILEPMTGSAIVTAIIPEEPEWSICLQVGAAALLDKPIMVIVKPGARIPSKLALIADEIVELDEADASFHERMREALIRMGVVPT